MCTRVCPLLYPGQPKICSIVSEVFEGILESRVKCGACKKASCLSFLPPSIPPSVYLTPLSPQVSVVHEPFQDLSLPIPGIYMYIHILRSMTLALCSVLFVVPGRKEMAKSQQRVEKEPPEPSPAGGKSGSSFSRGLCTVINLVSQVRDMFAGPPTEIRDCLDAFFDPSELKGQRC